MRNLYLMICFVIVLSGCGKYSRDFEIDESSFDAEILQMIQKESGVELPKGVKGLHFFYKAPIDPAFLAKIEIPEEAKSQILKKIIQMENESININDELKNKLSWWTPSKGTILIDRQSLKDQVYFRVILTEEGTRTILYIEHSID